MTIDSLPLFLFSYRPVVFFSNHIVDRTVVLVIFIVEELAQNRSPRFSDNGNDNNHKISDVYATVYSYYIIQFTLPVYRTSELSELYLLTTIRLGECIAVNSTVTSAEFVSTAVV